MAEELVKGMQGESAQAKPDQAEPAPAGAALEPKLPHGGVVPVTQQTAELSFVEGGGGGSIVFHDFGGRLLLHCQVVLVYWGTAWANPATGPSAGQFTAAINDIVYGPWGIQLSQYRGIGPMSVEHVGSVTTYDPPARFTNLDIQNLLGSQFNAGALPLPSPSIDRLYCVLLPPGFSSGDTNFVGQHGSFNWLGANAYYAWVTNDGTLTGGNSIPKIFSHELAEAVSDPDVGSGIILDVGSESEEIGDICNFVYTTVDGAAHEAYWSHVDNRCVNPVSGPLLAVTGNPVLIQSRFGHQGNFELVTPLDGGSMDFYSRNNDSPYLPWTRPSVFGAWYAVADGVTMIQSNFGSPGNLEVVARAGNQLYHFWRDSGPALNWNGGDLVGQPGVSGNPVLIQSHFGQKGNFELVAPLEVGGLAAYWRDNDAPGLPWHGPLTFAQQLGRIDALTMIQSNLGHAGNFELIARAGGQLVSFWRDNDAPGFPWNGPIPLIQSGAAGVPALIQSRFGNQGNFELVTPLAKGGLAHFWRNNDVPGYPWIGPFLIAQDFGSVDAVTMIQSNFGTPGNLELILRSGGKLYYYWRDSTAELQWHGPSELDVVTW